MRKRTIVFSLGAVVALSVIAAPILLAPGEEPADTLPVASIDSAEHAQTIEAMRPKRERPVIAILALNDATEVSDFLVSYGVLKHANVADVTVVAERAEPVRLYPSPLSIEPQATTRSFDEHHPDGPDYVVVPAMEPRNDPFVMDWILAQHRKGAKIVSICNGARTLAAAGLLDGRRATAHWSAIRELQEDHPTMRWVKDRRYVADNGITTSTGITASVPLMITLVEAIGGREVAERVAGELGVTNWDARHRTAAFQLTREHKKTFIRNTLALWRHETVGLPLVDNVDEIALALTADAYYRTALATVTTVGTNGKPIRSRHGLTIYPEKSKDSSEVDHMLAPPSSDAPAMAIERELARIAARYDRHTAAIVALTMEYPWAADHTRMAHR